jgi:hypothetical protein
MTRCLLITAVALAGCAKAPPEIVPVEGVVLLNGQPLPHAEVQFVPMSPGLGAEYVATATTDESGRFTLTCRGRQGACACENRVTVSDAPAPDDARGMSGESQTRVSRYYAALKNRPIPAAYASVARTPLAVAVAAGRAEYRLELKR